MLSDMLIKTKDGKYHMSYQPSEPSADCEKYCSLCTEEGNCTFTPHSPCSMLERYLKDDSYVFFKEVGKHDGD